jgi:hypothetical protein
MKRMLQLIVHCSDLLKVIIEFPYVDSVHPAMYMLKHIYIY